MSKYIDAEKLISEILKLRSESCISESDDYYEYAKSEIIDIIESIQQKPREWCEEDNEMLDAMIDIVSNSLYEPLCPREGMLAWLKSLRPQPSWKPSKEQMEALEITAHLANFGCDIGRRNTLLSLCNELKKL